MFSTLFLSLISSFFITYLVIPFFKKKSWVSLPNERTSHRGIIPVGGSIGFITVSITNFILDKDFTFIFFLILATIGFLDDLKNLSTNFRLIIQSTVGIVYCSIIFKSSVFGSIAFNQSLWVLNIFIIACMAFFFVSLINFTNFADGLDGLLTGSMIIVFSAANYLVDHNFIPLIGALVGFLILNWHPAKVFMGDSGSYFLGATYFSAIVLSDSWIDCIALILIGSPIYADTMICVIRRYFNKQNILKPHKLHLFQRLNQNGLEHWKVSLMYICSVLFLALSYIFGNIFILGLSAFLVFIFGIFLDLKIAKPFIDRSSLEVIN